MISDPWNQKYILDDDHNLVPATFDEWGAFFSQIDKRRVARTNVNGCDVSTVFLGMNHNYGDGPPLLFETMIFGGPENDYTDRCTTWAEAEEMHKRACAVAAKASASDQQTGPSPNKQRTTVHDRSIKT